MEGSPSECQMMKNVVLITVINDSETYDDNVDVDVGDDVLIRLIWRK